MVEQDPSLVDGDQALAQAAEPTGGTATAVSEGVPQAEGPALAD